MQLAHCRSRIHGVLTLAILAAVATASSGCFWLAVGGAGAAGYEIAKDDRSFGTKVDDATITSSVKAKFAEDSRVDALDINVDTYAGRVTLNGHVPSRSVKSRAAELARSVKGVKSVESKLRIIPD